EPVIHDDWLEVLERSARYKILSKDIPCSSHHSGGCVAAALGHVQASSLSRDTDRGLVGSVVTLPILTLHHEPWKVARSVAEINPIPVRRSFPTPVDLCAGIIAFTS